MYRPLEICDEVSTPGRNCRARNTSASPPMRSCASCSTGICTLLTEISRRSSSRSAVTVTVSPSVAAGVSSKLNRCDSPSLNSNSISSVS